MTTIRFELTPEAYEQLKVDLEGSKEELEELSREVDWFVTAMPERLQLALALLEDGRLDND